MKIPITGPSYDLSVRRADCQRSVNMFPVIVESGAEQPARAYMQSVPGLVLDMDVPGPRRGAIGEAPGDFSDRFYVVGGAHVYEVRSNGAYTDCGVIENDGKPVSMAYNRTQLILVTSHAMYYLPLGTTVVQTTTLPVGLTNFSTVTVLAGRAVLVGFGNDRFYYTGIDDASVIDALDFFTAESNPDLLVAGVADHGDLLLFGTRSLELWQPTSDPDEPFARNRGANIDVGAVSWMCIRPLDNTVYWVGQDQQGFGVLWKLNGYTPVRVSKQNVEEALQSVASLANATAYTYQQGGHSFYCLTVPGLPTTWCLDVATGEWHERCEWVAGTYAQHRGRFHVFVFGRHLLCAADQFIYEIRADVNNNAGDILMRERITPHSALPGEVKLTYGPLVVTCIVGKGKPGGGEPLMMLCYSEDGGETYCNWKTKSIGVAGERKNRVKFERLGASRDRVWHFRCTDDTPFALVAAEVGATR